MKLAETPEKKNKTKNKKPSKQASLAIPRKCITWEDTNVVLSKGSSATEVGEMSHLSRDKWILGICVRFGWMPESWLTPTFSGG